MHARIQRSPYSIWWDDLRSPEDEGRGAAGILMQPDGSRAYVAVNGENYVAIIDLKTLAETGRISTGKGPDGMAWAR